jgi:hypothetical protein
VHRSDFSICSPEHVRKKGIQQEQDTCVLREDQKDSYFSRVFMQTLPAEVVLVHCLFAHIKCACIADQYIHVFICGVVIGHSTECLVGYRKLSSLGTRHSLRYLYTIIILLCG